MILYHGSTEIVSRPMYGYGRRDNDYGQGFYCTESKELGKEWSCRSQNDGILNIYSLETRGLKVLDLTSPQYSILNWLAVLLQNRVFDSRSPTSQSGKVFIKDNYSIDTKEFDIIRGYRADDSYYSFARDFLDNVIPVSKLEQAMGFGDLGVQIMIRSESAFDRIAFEGCEKVDWHDYHRRYENRDLKARRDYSVLVKVLPTKDDVYLVDLMTGRASL